MSKARSIDRIAEDIRDIKATLARLEAMIIRIDVHATLVRLDAAVMQRMPHGQATVAAPRWAHASAIARSNVRARRRPARPLEPSGRRAASLRRQVLWVAPPTTTERVTRQAGDRRGRRRDR